MAYNSPYSMHDDAHVHSPHACAVLFIGTFKNGRLKECLNVCASVFMEMCINVCTVLFINKIYQCRANRHISVHHTVVY